MSVSATGTTPPAETVIVFTDGAKNKRGCGAAFWIPGTGESGSERITEGGTNNVAEFTAVLLALRHLRGVARRVDVRSDSQYVINCLTTWFLRWQRNGWKTASGSPVKNKDLIQRILALHEEFEGVTYRHVRAHTGSGDPDAVNNDIVDKLAVATASGEVFDPATAARMTAAPRSPHPVTLIGDRLRAERRAELTEQERETLRGLLGAL